MYCKSVIFFVHRFNDVDHIAPIVFRVAKDTDYNIYIFSLSPSYMIFDDFRLIYLNKNYGVNINYLYKSVYPSIFHKIFSFFYCKDTGKKLSSLLLIISGKSRFFMKLLFKNVYGENWCKIFFDEYDPALLVFDNTAAASRIYNFLAISSVSIERSIPKISLPHGVPLFVRHPKSYDNAKSGTIKNLCEKIILPSERWMKECIDYGVSPERLSVIGVARHCEEWEEILQDIVPWNDTLSSKGKGKLKVVYMDMGPDRYEEYKPVVEQTINRINSLEFVHLLFKPHTRSNRANLLIPENVENCKNVNSHNLIKWADVVIGMSSSIILGVLMQNTIYISPAYFREIKMVHEEYGACWVVDSIDELENALQKLFKDPLFKPYPQKNVDRFLTEIVYAGEKGKDVLGEYKELIVSSAKSIVKLSLD